MNTDIHAMTFMPYTHMALFINYLIKLWIANDVCFVVEIHTKKN